MTRRSRWCDAAKAAGASAVKLQTLRADGLVAGHCPPPAHVAVSSLREFFRQFELDEVAHHLVAARARHHGLALLSTPFDLEAVDLLERVGVDAYKIASGDITHRALIERVAATRTPDGDVNGHELARRSADGRRLGPRGWRHRDCGAALRLGVPDPGGQREPRGHCHARPRPAACRSACRTTARGPARWR